MLTDRAFGMRWFAALMLVGFLAGCGGRDSAAPSATGSGAPQPQLGESAPSADLKRIIILTNGNAPFWDAAAAGARDAEKELNCAADGFQVVVDRNDFKAEGQIEKLRQYASATDVAAVAISVTDAQNNAIPDELRKLQKQFSRNVTKTNINSTERLLMTLKIMKSDKFEDFPEVPK